MGLLDKIKEDAAKAGKNKSKFFFVRDGEKKRIRFLMDMEDGMEISFHDNFEAGINVPCQEVFGRNCQYCDEEGIRTRNQYVWCVWDYDAAEVKLFMYPVNNCSPIPAIAQMYETYGTLLDRDFVISVTGKQQNKSFGVVPMDKNKFRNTKAKPLSEKAILKLLDKAFPDENADYSDDEDDDDDVRDTKKKGNKQVNKSSTKKPSKADDWEDDEDEEDDEVDYSEMSARELYNLCKERDIEALPKKPEKYYIRLLKEYDDAHDDWEDEEDDDDWDDED